MKIAHLPAGFFPNVGGAQIATHNIAEKQHLLGHDVYLIDRSTNKWGTYKALKNDVAYKLLPIIPKTLEFVRKAEVNYKANLSNLIGMQLRHYQRKYKFDVWHLNLLGPFIMYALPHLKKMGVPIVGTCRGMDIQKFPEAGYGWRLTDNTWEDKLRNAFNEIDILTAISNSVKKEYLELDVPEDKIFSIPNGVNCEYISAYEIDKCKIRQAVGWPEDKKIIITVGRNHPKKGYKFIPEIISHLIKERNDFLWVIVGKGSEEIYELAKQQGVAQYLKIMPQIGLKRSETDSKYQFPSGDLVSLYKAADIFAFPTLIETFGNVNLEAMAAGLPVVVTDAPGCRDIVFHNQNGLVSPVGDTLAMANNILKVMTYESLREALVANGTAYTKNISWYNVAKQYVSCYEEAIRRKQEHMISTKPSQMLVH